MFVLGERGREARQTYSKAGCSGVLEEGRERGEEGRVVMFTMLMTARTMEGFWLRWESMGVESQPASGEWYLPFDLYS